MNVIFVYYALQRPPGGRARLRTFPKLFSAVFHRAADADKL